MIVRTIGSGGWEGVLDLQSDDGERHPEDRHPKYSNAHPVPAVLECLESLTRIGHHRFAPDAVSLLDASAVSANLLSSAQVTDTYLVLLAESLGARLATFDAHRDHRRPAC